MSLKSSLSWMGLAQLISFGLQFATSIVLARYLTPYEAGIYGISLATVGLLSLVQALGLSALIVREEVLTTEIARTAFTINALIAVGLATAIALASTTAGAALSEPGVARVLLVLAVNPLIGIFSLLPTANLERRGRFKELAIMGTISGTITAGTTIILALRGFSYMSVAYAQLGGALIGTILVNVVGRQFVSLHLGFASWRRVGDFGLQMLAVGGVHSLSNRVSDIVLGHFLGLSALGLYNRAANLNNLVWSNIHLAIARVVLVDYAELHRQGQSLRGRYIGTVEIVTAALWPAFAGVAVIAGPFIQIVYGARWVPSAGPLALLALASMVLVAITMTFELFAATGNLRTQTRIEFIRAGLALGSFSLACLVSIEAAAAARVFEATVAVVLYRPYLNKMTSTNFADFIPIYSKSAFLTLLAVAPVGMIMGMHKMSADVPLLLLFAGIALGFLLWIAGLSILDHPILQEVKKTLNARGLVFRLPLRKR